MDLTLAGRVMADTFLVAIDGSSGSNRALEAAMGLAKASGASIVIAHVIEWSAFSFHTAEELAERHRRREEELDRARETLLEPCERLLAAEGFECEAVVTHGHPSETLADIAKERGVSNIFIGRKGQSRIGVLLFGSVAGSLIQISPVAVTVVP